jgi:hypothetical protein
MPYFENMEYDFCLPQGGRTDTVAVGILDRKGEAVIDLSATHPGYCGVGRFRIQVYNKTWNVVIGGNENFILRATDESDNDPTFEYSEENRFLLDALARQKQLINDFYEAASASTELRPLVLASPQQRMQEIEKAYHSFRREIEESPLYAARILEILNLLTGAGSSFSITQEELPEEQREFIVHKLNFEDLYTSGFWQHVFDLWFQLTSLREQQQDSLLLNDSRLLLERTTGIPLRRELTQSLIRLFIKYGKDALLMELGTEYLTMPLNGQLAPELRRNDASTFLPRNSLILFYEADCGICRNELENLKNKYQLLLDNNIRVITLAADLALDIFEETSARLPWPDKLCDYKGFDGENFLHYGIVGTPTYILTDEDGIVRGRYAQLKELLKE